MGYKWSKDQYVKYSLTMKRKRDERIKKLMPKPFIVETEIVENDATKLNRQHEFLDNFWRTLTAQDKVRALGFLVKGLF